MNRTLSKTLLIFFIPAFCILLISYLISTSSIYSTQADLFSMALTIDLCVVIPVIYFLSIHKTRISKVTVIPVILLSYLWAGFIIPSNNQSYLQTIKWVFIPIEFFAAAYLIYKVRLVINHFRSLGKNVDFLECMSQSLYKVFGENKAADIMTTELSVFYYGFGGWWIRKEQVNGKAFSYHKDCGYPLIAAVFFFLIILETVSLHLLIVQWNFTIAMILLAISVYGLIFLMADLNAARKRPILVDGDKLDIRIGLRWRATVPFENIQSVELVGDKEYKGKEYANLTLAGTCNLMIHLEQKMKVKGFYGISKKVNKLILSVDSKQEFIQVVNQKLTK